MAAFKVGQRVKRVRDPIEVRAAQTTMPIGATGVVINPDDDGNVRVQPDSSSMDLAWGCQPDTLAPLTDPGAERFLASLRKLGNEPNILAPQELERVKGGV